MAKSFKRQKRQKRVKKGGMNPDELRPPTLAEMRRSRMDATAPSSNRRKLEYAQMMHGPTRRPTGKQDRNLAKLAAETSVPRRVTPQEERITNLLKKRTPTEVQRDREMNKQLSMRPLLPTVVRLQRQQDLIKELRSVAPPNKKGEFDRLITQCDRDREMLKQFIIENLNKADGIDRMEQDHLDPLLNRDLPDIKIIGELKDIVNRCSRNRIELLNIIKDVYPNLKDINEASGVVEEGVAKYLKYQHQPGYAFVKGALESLTFVDDDLLDVFDQEKVIDRLRRERRERLSKMKPVSKRGSVVEHGVRPGSVLERLLEERRLRKSLPEGMDNTAILLRSLMGNPIKEQPPYSYEDLERSRLELRDIGDSGNMGELLKKVLGESEKHLEHIEEEEPNPLLQSGYMDNGEWILRSSPRNTKYLPRMDYTGSKRKTRRRSNKKTRRRRRKKQKK